MTKQVDPVFITDYGQYYHRQPRCGRGKYIPSMRSVAVASGKDPCPKCCHVIRISVPINGICRGKKENTNKK